MKHLIWILLILSFNVFAGELPLSFTNSPTVIDMAAGQTQHLQYTIRNNVSKQSLPIKSISVLNDSNQQPSANAGIFSSTCPAFLPPHQQCQITVSVHVISGGALNCHLSIDYNGREPLTSQISLRISGQAAYTILIYMVGTDLESEHNNGTFNINQMKQIGSSSRINIVLETGGANKPGWLTVQRKIIFPGQEVLLSDEGSIDMGLESTIESFITWGLQNFPANKYILVFWDHGGGPNGGFGGNEVHSDTPTPINELSSAIQTATANTGKQFEIIGFDACLLGNLETYSGLHNYTNYLLGSEDLEPGKGWQYNTWLNYINNNPTADGLAIGTEIVNGFTEQNRFDSTTLSVVSSAEIPNVITALNNFTTALSLYVDSNIVDWKNVARGRLRAPDYSTSVWDSQSTDVADLIGLANGISAIFAGDPVLQTSAQQLINTTQNAVKYYKNSSNRGASYGLTIYFPSILARYNTGYPNKTVLNGQSFFSTQYTTMVSDYYNFYLNNTASLIANPGGLAFNGVDYTGTVSNDFEELYATVGNDNCTNVFNDDGSPLAVPCYTALQSEGFVVTPAGGNIWNVAFNKATHATTWPLLNGVPVLLIPLDTEPQIPNEISYLIPASAITSDGNVDGYLNVVYADNVYRIEGFQREAGSVLTQPKPIAIEPGEQFYIRTYAFIGGTWRFLRTSVQVTAPLSISFGSLPIDYNAFRFLVSDLTGKLTITNNSAPY